MNSVKPYSPREQDYIRRVAGKVPADVMASTIGRTRNSLVNWANRHGISLSWICSFQYQPIHNIEQILTVVR